jgi:hypothetical protein
VVELKELKKYRCKDKNAKLYLQCEKIKDQFLTKGILCECHHCMSSQKNEAMNKSIMRYVPKEKTYARSMALTSQINIAIGIDCVGHAVFYERLFRAMGFQYTQHLPFLVCEKCGTKRNTGGCIWAKRR